MADETAERLIQQHEKLKTTRTTFENHWDSIAPLVLPRQDDFFGQHRPQGEERTEEIFDGTAPLALERFAAAVESLLTPRNQKWHTLKATLPELNENQEVKEYFDRVTNILFQARNSPAANYPSQQYETYISLGAFGTGIMFLADVPGFGMRYKSIHLGEVYIAQNFAGQIDWVNRQFKMTAKEAVEKFSNPDDNLPSRIRDSVTTNPMNKFEFLHVVKPNPDFRADREGPDFAKFNSWWIAMQETTTINKEGFDTFPYIVSRYVTAPQEIYGRSPAMAVLPDIRMVNEMSKEDIRATHLVTRPPILAHGDGVIDKFSMKPGSINYGGVDAQGRQLIHPFNSNARVDINEAKMETRRKIINDAFLVSLFQILVDSPAMTATEVLQRVQEKGELLSPTLGRQQSEALGPMIVRELDILTKMQVIPPMPDILVENLGEFEVEYTSPLARAAMAEEALGTERTVQAAIAVAGIDASIVDKIDFDEYLDILGRANGAPAKLFKDDEEVAEIRNAKAQAQQAAQIAQAAPQVAGAIKDVAQAGEIIGAPA